MLMTTAVPENIVLKSSVHTSGRSRSTCATRSSGRISVLPGAATFGSSSDGMKRPPSPVERLRITSQPAFADAADDLVEKLGPGRALAGRRIARMQVHDRCPCARRIDGGSRDLLWRHRQRRVLLAHRQVAGDGAGEDRDSAHVRPSVQARPASTRRRSPVMPRPPGLARNSAASATSSGSTQRRSDALSV